MNLGDKIGMDEAAREITRLRASNAALLAVVRTVAKGLDGIGSLENFIAVVDAARAAIKAAEGDGTMNTGDKISMDEAAREIIRLRASNAALLTALKSLMSRWEIYEHSDMNQQDAYYALAKRAYEFWDQARAAIKAAEGDGA